MKTAITRSCRSRLRARPAGRASQTRSTRPAIQVEACSACHPAYTGAERRVRTSDRIERSSAGALPPAPAERPHRAGAP